LYDIIPDIHGQAEKLRAALKNLGYRQRSGAWRHGDRDRMCVFLGDYIDRGPENAAVIDIVRSMVDAGTALAIMGNHELNAIHFHTTQPGTPNPLREHSAKNMHQHAAFLAEFPVGEERTREAIDWMKSLPLFLELEEFRAIHACWDEVVIEDLGQRAKDGCLSDEQFLHAADKNSNLFHLIETTVKGPEGRLPEGFQIFDKQGTGRKDVRLQWWSSRATTWRDIAISVPNPTELPNSPLPSTIKTRAYPVDAKPVFFGHYWMTGDPVLQAPNALCLDYSAGTDGRLVSHSSCGEQIDLAHLNLH
jgi:hypothetical protein